MKKQLYWLFPHLLLCILLSISGCREEEMIMFDNKKTESKVFQIFEKKENQNAREDNSLYYQNAFRDLYFSYYHNNPEEAPDFNDASAPQINFNYASQVMYTEDSTIYVLFPVMIDSEVKHIVVASVNAKHDYVSFYFAAHDKIIENAINEFSTQSRGRPGFDMNNPAPIEEVIISLPTSSSISHIEPFDGMLPPSGGCWVYNNCAGVGGGSGGGGTRPVIQPQHNPCEKIKALVNNPVLKSKIDELKNFSLTAEKDEKGYQQDKSGNVTPALVNGAHYVDFMIDQNSLGGIHCHTLNGTHMFSPPDILSLLTFAQVQNQTLPVGSTADYTGNAFIGMISQSGSYFITFNGGSGDLPPPMTDAEEDAFELKLNDEYKKLL